MKGSLGQNLKKEKSSCVCVSHKAYFALLGIGKLLLFTARSHTFLSKCKLHFKTEGSSSLYLLFWACLKIADWQGVNQLSCWEVNLNELSLNSYKKLISLENDSIKHLYNPEKGWQV